MKADLPMIRKEESALHPTSPFVLQRGVPQVEIACLIDSAVLIAMHSVLKCSRSQNSLEKDK